MSSTVGSRRTRSTRSYSLTGLRLLLRLVDGDERRGGVDPVLRLGRDRVAAAEDPGVVVDALARVVVLEAGLDVEQVALERARQREWLAGEQQRRVDAAGTESRRRGGVAWTLDVRDRQVLPGH